MYDLEQLSMKTKNWITIFRIASEELYQKDNREVDFDWNRMVQIRMRQITSDRMQKLDVLSILTGRTIYSGKDLKMAEAQVFWELSKSNEFIYSCIEIIVEYEDVTYELPF